MRAASAGEGGFGTLEAASGLAFSQLLIADFLLVVLKSCRLTALLIVLGSTHYA